jgi:parallel beta-helix repeat protein
MSPQQARGDRPRATDDLYSFGATLFELLTGRAPFFAGDLNYQRQHVPAPLVLDRRRELHQCDSPIPEHWEITIQRLLAKYPEHRPQSAREVAEALKGCTLVAGATVGGSSAGALGDAIPAQPPTKPSPSASATNLSLPRAGSGWQPMAPAPAAQIPLTPARPGAGFPGNQLPPPGALPEPGQRTAPTPATAPGPAYAPHSYAPPPAYPAASAYAPPPAPVRSFSRLWLWLLAVFFFVLLVLGGFGLGFLLLGELGGKVLRVPGAYGTIQAALDAAKSGDKVRVAPGTYREFIRLKDGVTLQGEDAARCVLEIADNAPSVVRGDRVTGAKVDRFTISTRGLAQGALYVLGFVPEETSDGGVQVKSVSPDGPASRAGLPAGAKIISIDGEPVPYWEDVVGLTARYAAPHPTAVVFVHRGTQRTLTITSHLRTFGNYFVQGVVLRESQADLTGCTFRGTGGPAIVVLGTTARGEISGNTVQNSGSSGIVVAAAGNGLTLRGNTVEGSKLNGFEISGGASPLVTANISRRNEQAGIAVFRRGSAPQLLENICEWNKWDGILFHNGAGGLARGNQARSNEDNGIYVGGEGTNPTLTGNVSTSNRKYGISVWSGSRPQIAEDNQLSGNVGGTIER